MFAFLADIHISNKLKPLDYLQSLETFLNHIKQSEEECHAIFILGDLFDHRLDVDESKLAAVFLLRLVTNHCGATGSNIPCYFIHGTYSHDLDQYGIFFPVLKKLENVYIYYSNEMCEMTLVSGHTLLMLPQEYNKDYKDIFNKHYDIIIGHGVVSSFTKAPCQNSHGDYVFQSEELSKISNICVFGHYHEYTDFGGNVFYAGSMLRSKYNEDTPKQFLFCNDKYEVHTLKNPHALEYKTIRIETPEQLREIIATDIKTPHRFVIPTNDEIHMEEFSAIMGVNKNNKFITYKLETKPTDQVEESIDEIVIEKKTNITNPVPELIEYIKNKYDVNVEEQINDYVNEINKKEEE